MSGLAHPGMQRTMVGAALSVYTALVLLSTVPFLLLHAAPALRHRNPALTALAVLCNIAVVVVTLLPVPLPCAVVFWIPAVFSPLFVLILCARGVQLAFAFRVGEEALIVAARDGSGRERSQSVASLANTLVEPPALAGDKTRRFRDRSLSMSSVRSTTSSTLASTTRRASVWYTRNRRQASTAYLSFYIAVFMIVYVCGLIPVQIYSDRLNNPLPPLDRDCTARWEFIPMYSVLGFLLVIVTPWILYLLRDVHDAFGIRVELIFTSLVWIASLVLEIIWIYAPQFSTMVRGLWPPAIWTATAFAISHILIVMRPVWLHWRHRQPARSLSTAESNEHGSIAAGHHANNGAASSQRAFELVLTDPALFDDFKLFAVKDFSVENALFYERAAELRQMPPPPLPSASGAGSVAADALSREARKIYYLFLREHADLQLNLSMKTVRDIESDIRLKRFYPAMFDRALAEVVQLMWTDTYPRYVRSQTNVWRKDISRRITNGGGIVGGALYGIMGLNVSQLSVGSLGNGGKARKLTPIPL